MSNSYKVTTEKMETIDSLLDVIDEKIKHDNNSMFITGKSNITFVSDNGEFKMKIAISKIFHDSFMKRFVNFSKNNDEPSFYNFIGYWFYVVPLLYL